MNEVDEHGWAHIHHASKKGYFKSVEKFIKADDNQLEFETQDEFKETPLLVAVRAGISNVDTIRTIVELNGNVKVLNAFNHGIVEICCLLGHTDVLDYFVKLNHEDLPVWQRLLKFCSSDIENEAESAGRCLAILTKPKGIDTAHPYWRNVYDLGGITLLVKVIKGNIGDRAKAQAIQCLINMLMRTEVKEEVVNNGGLDAAVHHLKSVTDDILRLTSIFLAMLCSVGKYAEQASNLGTISALVNVFKSNKVNEVLVEAINALGVVCNHSEVRQTLLYHTAGGIQSLSSLIIDNTDASLLLALMQCVGRVARRHEVNQNAIIDCGITSNIISLCEIKNRDLQLRAVDAVHMLVEGNAYTQRVVKQEGATTPLMMLLKRSKNQTVQEKTAGALWALAGGDEEERRSMAARMEVNLLIEFIGSLSESLHFIGSEGLGVLAQGALNKQDEIAEANGVHPLVRLLKSDKEYLVLSAIRSIRHLCVSIGYIPHNRNQVTVFNARGIKLLIALMTLSRSELIQSESALTLASVSLGNETVLEEIWSSSQNLEFSYLRVLKLLQSSDGVVRLLAGAALATFAYNNMGQQQGIAAEGGVRFSCFVDFLKNDDEYFRCNTAFQVVILARIIPDEEQAISSAAGIKLIVDILNESRSPVILALAADCVARLSHTRAGITSAFIAINTVERLCDLLTSEQTQVRGAAAIALSYLSHNHKAERQLLNRCRLDPYLIKCLKYYDCKGILSPRFLHEWKHYKKVGLPPIKDGRPSLVTQQGHRIPTVLKPQEAQLPNGSKSNITSGLQSRSPQPSAEGSILGEKGGTSLDSKISLHDDELNGADKTSHRSHSVLAD